jgi:hypothetical protein
MAREFPLASPREDQASSGSFVNDPTVAAIESFHFWAIWAFQ